MNATCFLPNQVYTLQIHSPELIISSLSEFDFIFFLSLPHLVKLAPIKTEKDIKVKQNHTLY